MKTKSPKRERENSLNNFHRTKIYRCLKDEEKSKVYCCTFIIRALVSCLIKINYNRNDINSASEIFTREIPLKM